MEGGGTRGKGACKCLMMLVEDQTLRKEKGSAAMRGVMNSDEVLVWSAGSELLKRPEDR